MRTITITSLRAPADDQDGFYRMLVLQHWTNRIELRIRILQVLASLVYGQVTTYRRIAIYLGLPAWEAQNIGTLLKEIEEKLEGRFHTEQVLHEDGTCSPKYPGGEGEQASRLLTRGVSCHSIYRVGGIGFKVNNFTAHLYIRIIPMRKAA